MNHNKIKFEAQKPRENNPREVKSMTIHGGRVDVLEIHEFLSRVKKQVIPTLDLEIARMNPMDIEAHVYLDPALATDLVIHTSKHRLFKHDFGRMISRIRSQSTKARRSSTTDIFDLVYEFTSKSYEHFGLPDCFVHLIGNEYALLSSDDFTLYTNDNRNWALICTAPKRNFVITAPKLSLEIRK